MNVLAETPLGAVFLTNVCANGVEKTADWIANSVLIPAIDKLGPEKVQFVVMDSAANCKAAGQIVENHYHELGFCIFCLPCAAHSVSLFFKDVGKIEEVAELIAWAKMIVSSRVLHQ